MAAVPSVHGKAIHPLPKGKIFTHTHHVERHGLAQIEHDFWGGNAVIGRPIGFAIAIDDAGRRRTAGLCRACCWRTLRPAGQIDGKRRAQDTLPLSQYLGILLRDLPRRSGGIFRIRLQPRPTDS